MDNPTKPADPRDLLDRVLGLIAQDLHDLGARKKRTPQEMLSISRYAKDLHAICKSDEAESLQIQRELARLSPAELAERLQQEAAGNAPVNLSQAIADATKSMMPNKKSGG